MARGGMTGFLIVSDLSVSLNLSRNDSNAFSVVRTLRSVRRVIFGHWTPCIALSRLSAAGFSLGGWINVKQSRFGSSLIQGATRYRPLVSKILIHGLPS